MATRRKTSPQFLNDVSFYWTGGRNVTWRLTHEPTGIVVEGSTEFPGAQFTKKRLRMAEEQLKTKLLKKLEQRVKAYLKAAARAG